MCSRTSSAMYSMKLTTNSGLPLNFARSSGFCVATPTGHVSRWQTRIITQPLTTSGAVANPNSSAPSSAAITTSRPVFSWPSACTTMRSRSPFSNNVCWVSARPSSHGAPACFSDVSGLAPVPPSWPLINTTSAFGLADAGGDCSDTDFGDQLDVDACCRVGVLQIVDQLLEVFDRIDVVMRRWTDQSRRPASSTGSQRSTDTPCGPAAVHPRRAWRPAPS